MKKLIITPLLSQAAALLPLPSLTSLASLVFTAILVAPANATAAILLAIDVSDSNAVTFTATGERPSSSTSSKKFIDGITLGEFFRIEPESSSFTISGTLTPAFFAGSPSYTRLALVGASDLNIYVNSANPQSGSSQFFQTGVAAFTGSFTVDMSSIAYSMPLAGTQGTLHAGYGGSVVAIGNWSAVVPEPGQWELGALFGVGLLAFRALRGRLQSR